MKRALSMKTSEFIKFHIKQLSCNRTNHSYTEVKVLLEGLISPVPIESVCYNVGKIHTLSDRQNFPTLRLKAEKSTAYVFINPTFINKNT